MQRLAFIADSSSVQLGQEIPPVAGGAGPFQFSEPQTKVRFQQTHNQGLRQLFLTVSWDLCA